MSDNQNIEFLKSLLLNNKNIIISGSTGSGKTTLLESPIYKTPSAERLIIIEDEERIQV